MCLQRLSDREVEKTHKYACLFTEDVEKMNFSGIKYKYLYICFGLHEQSCSDLFLTCQISCNFKGTIAFGNIKDYLPSVKNPRDKKAHPEREVRSVVHAQKVKN